ncbi:MAG: DUF1080 domain-containing protein [Planctomycetota bacterium]
MLAHLCTLLLLLAAFTAPARADDSGFVDLFDGESLDGWVQRGGEAPYKVVADAEGGPEIVGTSVMGTPNSFLCTDRDYADFVLEFEVWVDPAVNSGVQFRSNVYDAPTGDRPAGRVHGYQCELDPSDRSWSGGIYDEARRGWLFNLEGDEHADARAAFKPGDWNQMRIEAVGDSIKTFVNGVQAADLSDGMTATGFIGLQVHGIGKPEQAGKQIRWRKLRIQETP